MKFQYSRNFLFGRLFSIKKRGKNATRAGLPQHMFSILTNVNQEAWVFKPRNEIKKVYGPWALRLLLNKVQRAKFETNWISRSCRSNWGKQILDTTDSLLRVKFLRNLDKKYYSINVKTLLCLKCITGINLNRKKKRRKLSPRNGIFCQSRG